MMQIAIPAFQTKISPRFDCALRMLIVEAVDGAVQNRCEESIEHLHWRHRIALLVDRGVDVVLCGGIRRWDYFSLLSAGIDVYAGLVGEVEDVLHAFLENRISKWHPEDERAVVRGRGRGKRWGHRSPGKNRVRDDSNR